MKRLGPTGHYPEGKLNEDDEGELTFGISNDGDHIIVDYGKPVAWIAFPPDTARQFAALLLEHANQLDPKGTS